MIGRKRTFLRKFKSPGRYLHGTTVRSGRGMTPTKAMKGRTGGARKSGYSKAKRR